MADGLWIDGKFVPFKKASGDLSKEIAVRSRSVGFQATGMALPNPDPILKKLGKDIKVYRELENDGHVGGCVRRRKAAVKALQWGIGRDSGGGALIDRLERIFSGLKLDRIFTEILDAALYGYQPMEVIWGEVNGWIVPVDIIGKPAEWFIFNEDNQLRLRTKENQAKGEELPPRKFLLPRQGASYSNPYGRPDLSMCFWPTTFKNGGLKFWVNFTEKYGSPWVIGKHPRGASVGETDLLLDSLENMIQDAIAAIPDDSSIDILEPGGKQASADIYERLLYYCRSEIAIALLGQNQTTEAEANRASATAGLAVTDDIRDSDAAMVMETINELIGWIADLNADSEERPLFEMWSPEDDAAKATRDEVLKRAGANFNKKYFANNYGIAEEELDDAAPAQASPFGMGGMNFSEAVHAPDQVALDDALDKIVDSTADDDLQVMLAPVFSAIKKGVTPDRLLGMLADLYPQMDASGLQERLARMIFTSKLWGRINANDGK